MTTETGREIIIDVMPGDALEAYFEVNSSKHPELKGDSAKSHMKSRVVWGGSDNTLVLQAVFTDDCGPGCPPDCSDD